jgi:hypothetical protein
MKKTKNPTASKLTVLRQLCNYIPNHLVPQLACETGMDEQARTHDEWSHIVTLCYAQLTHSIGLNDVCDARQLNSGPAVGAPGRDPALAQQPLARQQGARPDHGRKTLLGRV